MAQVPVQHPFKRIVAVCAALVAVVLSTTVLVVGGVLVLAVMILVPTVSGLGAIGAPMLVSCLIVIGIVNMLCVPHITDAKAYADPRLFLAVNIANSVLIVLAGIMLVAGSGQLMAGLVGGTALTALLAIHFGRTKPIPSGHCQWCGYNLAGLGKIERGICPECGADITHAVPDGAE